MPYMYALPGLRVESRESLEGDERCYRSAWQQAGLRHPGRGKEGEKRQEEPLDQAEGGEKLVCVCVRACVCVCACVCARAYTRAYAHMQACICRCTCMYVFRTHAHMHACIHAPAHTHARADTHSRTLHTRASQCTSFVDFHARARMTNLLSLCPSVPLSLCPSVPLALSPCRLLSLSLSLPLLSHNLI